VGNYSWFVHLQCWRVPAKVWLAFGASPNREQIRASMHLMESVSICGFSEMSPEQQDVFIEHVLNCDNWARAPNNASRSDEKQAIMPQIDGPKVSSPSKATESGHSAAPSRRGQAPKVQIKDEDALVAQATPSASSAVIIRSEMSHQSRGGGFIMPIPGQNGALPDAMSGLIVVLTGL
jgi:hypothetical protein